MSYVKLSRLLVSGLSVVAALGTAVGLAFLQAQAEEALSPESQSQPEAYSLDERGPDER